MGTVSRYKQGRLASSAVGTPGLNRVAGAVAESVGRLANVIAQRQQALDNVDTQNRFYDYAQQDEIQRADLQKQHSLNPEAFQSAYLKSSGKLANQFRSKLSDRQKGTFDTLVKQRGVGTTKSNLRWTFDQQTKVALNGVEEGSTSFALVAGSLTSGDEFVEATTQYLEAFDQMYAPVLDPLTARSSRRKYVQNGARMYMASMSDNNGGGVIQLANDLKNNEEFKKIIIDAFDTKGLITLQKQADKQVVSFISEQGFDLLNGANKATVALVVELFDSPTGLSLAESEQNVIRTENALNIVRAKDPEGKVYGEHIKLLEEQLMQSQIINEIARNRNNKSIKTDMGIKAELQQKIKDATLGIHTTLERSTLAQGVAEDLLGVGDRGFSFRDFVKRFSLFSQVPEGGDPFGVGDKALVAPTDISKAEAKKGKKSYAEYLRVFYELKGEILAYRLAGLINDSTASMLIGMFASQLDTLDQYERLAEGTNDFAKAFNNFDRYAKNVSIPGLSKEASRLRREELRTNMMDEFISRRFTMVKQIELAGKGMGSQNVPADKLIKDVRAKFARALIPSEYGALTEGDIIDQFGSPVEFVQINGTTGRMVLRTPKELDKTLGNV